MAIRAIEKGKRHRIDWRDGRGKRRREVVYGNLTRAREVLAERRLEARKVRTGKLAYRSVRDDGEGPTFAEYRDRFLRDYASERRGKYYHQRLTDDGAMVSYFGDRALRSITEHDLDAFRRHRSATVGPSTVRKDLTLLGTMFKLAKRWGVIETNPRNRRGEAEQPEGAHALLQALTNGAVSKRQRPHGSDRYCSSPSRPGCGSARWSRCGGRTWTAEPVCYTSPRTPRRARVRSRSDRPRGRCSTA